MTQHTPACFAAASVFSHDSEVCKSCDTFNECSTASMITLEKIRGIVNVEDIMRRHAKAKKVAQAALVEGDKNALRDLPPGNGEKKFVETPVKRETKVTSVPFVLSKGEEDIIATLPVKPRKLAVSLCKAGFIEKIKRDLKSGVNTFDTAGPAFIRVALSSLLAGGFTKRALRDRYMVELSHAEDTAASHVSIVCSLVMAFGIAQENEGRIIRS